MALRHPRLAGALLATVGVLAGTAVYNSLQASKAERAHPPMGRFIEVDGVRLHYVERGQGRPVVLLHGLGAMVEDWAASGLLDQVAQHYRVIAFDRPGFGHSDRPRDRLWTPEAQAKLIHDALQQLRIERPVVVGHSWGTMVSLALALDHPGEVDHLVLLSGYYFPTRMDMWLSAAPAIPVVGDAMRYTVSPILGRAFEGKVADKIFAPNPVPARFRKGFPMDLALRPSQIRASAEDAGLANPGAASLSARYGQVSVPAVIIAGIGDEIVDTNAQSVRLHDALRGSRLHLVPGTGHMIHYFAQPQILAAIEGH